MNEDTQPSGSAQFTRELLWQAVRTGCIANFDTNQVVSQLDDSQRDSPLTSRPKIAISAERIRELLTGVYRNTVSNSPAPTEDIPIGEIRIFGAAITGTLNLDDAIGKNGTSMPRLELIGCWFEQPIHMERCRIKSLSLRGCAFTALLGSEAVIEGPVDLSRVRSAQAQQDNNAGSWVVLAGARIAGRINAAYSKFAAPPQRGAECWVLYSKHSRYALDLRGTRISGSVNLRPQVSALGGVCLTLAKVEGSVWMNGGDFTAVEDCAFAADYCKIQGSLYFRPYDLSERERIQPADGTPSVRSIPFTAKGCISLYAANIGGSVYFSGASLSTLDKYDPDSPPEKRSVVDAATAVIEGDCSFSSWVPKTARRFHVEGATDKDIFGFVGDGDVDISGAIIRNDLYFSGAKVRRVFANNIEIAGNCDLTPFPHKKTSLPFLASSLIKFDGATIRGNFSMNGAKIGSLGAESGQDTLQILDPHYSQLECRIDRQFERIQKTSSSDPCFDIEESDSRDGVFARGINIGGNCFMGIDEGSNLRFECAGVIFVQEAKINNSFRMDGALILGPRLKSTIDLSGTKIGGKASFMTWDKSGLVFKLWGGEVGIKLAGARIGEALIMNGARIRGHRVSLNADNIEIGGKASLGTYEKKDNPQHNLFSFFSKGKISLVSATIKLGLDMSGATLSRSEAEVKDENSTVADALDLTLLRAKYVRLAEHGRCVSGDRHNPNQYVRFLSDGRVVMEHADIDADLDLEGSTFNSQLSARFVKVGGLFKLRNVKIASSLNRDSRPKEELHRDYRERNKSLKPDLSLNGARVVGALIADEVGLEISEREAEMGRREPFIVDLRSAHIGELDDNGGTGWSSDIRLWLEGLRYSWLPDTAVVPVLKSTTILHPRRIWDPSWIQDRGEMAKPRLATKTNIPGLWKHRARWLEKQYFEAGKPRFDGEFNPDAYEQVVRGMNATGSYEDARRIASIQLTRKSTHGQQSLRPLWVPFRILFDYGFSIKRALMSYIVCLALGSAAVWIADLKYWDADPILVVKVSPPESRWLEADNDSEVYPVKGAKGDVHTGGIPCGHHIQPVLYATDVFIPVLDLRQQEVCTIAPLRERWRVAQAAYAALGWVMTPLLILTVSGLLRRHLEK